MKSLIKSMSFRIWFYFLMLVGVLLLFLWMLQITFLEPYYASNRSQQIYSIVGEISRIMADGTLVEKESDLKVMLAKQNMCGNIYDSSGYLVMAIDVLGANCYLGSLSPISTHEYIELASASPSKEFNVPFKNEFFEQGMYFYGKEISLDTGEYYIFINTPIELLDSTVEILRNQFTLISFVVFSISTIAAILISHRLSYPISKMTTSAKKLAHGDFSVVFSGEGYNEVGELANALNFATSEFGKTDELRRDLVANVSHDIKTPLTMIKAYAEMIVDISGNDVAMREKHLNVIIDEANHLERLVNDMLTLSKYESQVFSVNESRYRLIDQITSAINLFQGLDINFDVQVDETIHVYADEVKMGQVLFNYISNATRFIGDDKTITIRADVRKDIVEVSVIDTGPGIEKEKLNQIWERYYKINKNYRRNETSSGLGLSIVRAICEATKSGYGVESDEGKGSRFYYTLRLKK